MGKALRILYNSAKLLEAEIMVWTKLNKHRIAGECRLELKDINEAIKILSKISDKFKVN